jgi:hypothetical protein
VKKQGRIFEKLLSYDGKFDRINDYGRASFEVKDLKIFPRVIELLSKAKEFKIVRTKNRLSTSWDPRDSAGYRDYQMLVQVPSGWIMELQIIPGDLYELKRELGHKHYTAFRFLIEAGIRARAKLAKNVNKISMSWQKNAGVLSADRPEMLTSIAEPGQEAEPRFLEDFEDDFQEIMSDEPVKKKDRVASTKSSGSRKSSKSVASSRKTSKVHPGDSSPAAGKVKK